MNTNQVPMAEVYTDFSGLNRLKSAAANNRGSDKQTVNKEVAQQFEAMYMQMMLKSMRQAVGPGIMDSSQSEMAQGLYDQQLAIQLSKQGAIGIGDLVLRQIEGPPLTANEKVTLKFAPQTVDAIPVSTGAIKSLPDTKPQKLFNLHVPDFNKNAIEQHQHSATTILPESPTVGSEQRPYQSAVTTPLSIPTDQPVTSKNPQQIFIAKIQPAAEAAAAQLGVDPTAIVAIAALETGWGKHIMRTNSGASSNNLFGIKADERWQKSHVLANTLEFENGAMRRKKEPFRVYGSAAESVMDFANFIEQNPRYQRALLNSAEPERFIDEIHQAGYATDPNYAKKVKAVMKTIENTSQDSARLADTR